MGRKKSVGVDKLVEGEIIGWFCKKMMVDKSGNKYFPNIKYMNYECDILEITKSGYSYEYEVKVTKADFKSDAKKSHTKRKYKNGKYDRHTTKKYDQISSGERVNHFYYIVPENMIVSEDVPEFAGLIYAYRVSEKRLGFQIIKTAPKLSNNKFPEEKMQKCLLSTYYRFHSYHQKKHGIV